MFFAVTNEDKFKEIEERLAQASIDFGKQIENLKIVHDLKLESLKEELKESHQKEMGQGKDKTACFNCPSKRTASLIL